MSLRCCVRVHDERLSISGDTDGNVLAHKLNQKFALSIPLGTLVGAVEVEVLVGAGALDAVPGMHWL